ADPREGPAKAGHYVLHRSRNRSLDALRESPRGRNAVRSRGAISMERKGAERGEQHGVAWYLQAELHQGLHGDRDKAGDGAEPDPVRGSLRRNQPTPDQQGERENRHEYGNPQQESTFNRQLEVIVVRFSEVISGH